MFGDWYVVEEATCTNEGAKERRCSECQKIDHDVLPILNHRYGNWIISIPSKCGTAGAEERTCDSCGNTETRNVEALEHNYGEYSVVSGSKLIPPIVKERKCIYCETSEQINDWSYIWITFLAAIAVIGVVIGLISYIRAFKKK